MKQRGRKSGASLSVVRTPEAGEVEAVSRPVAPDELTDEQAGEWSRIVDALPADWFPPETHGLLVQYCRHLVEARRVSQLIEQVVSSEEFNLANYNELLKMQEREGRAASSLATRMRLTQQATFDKEKSKGKGRGIKRPWEP